ncbi:MAG TPA: RodZ domain-containing protein [Burkholderiales bacterium]
MTELTGIGAALKQAREAQGLAIDDVALQLKFAPRQIESLEQERFDRLPGPTIARGMVRNYARLLKLDPEPLIERLSPRVESPPDANQIAQRFKQVQPFSDSAKRSTLLYAGFSVGVLLLVAALAYEWNQQKTAPPSAPAPERAQPAEPPAQTAAVPEQPAPAPEPIPAPAAAEKPPAEKKAVAEKRPPMEKKPAAPVLAEANPAAEKIAPPDGSDKPLAPGTHRIVLRTEAEAWLEVKDGAGRMLISSLNPAGTERVVRGQAPFDFVIGNASSVKLTYDGKPVDLRPHTKVEVARFTLK